MPRFRDLAIALVQIVVIVFAMKSFAFATNYIPSESMVPTLEVGDRLLVSKWPYGYSRYSLMLDPGVSAPAKDGRVFGRTPERGDVAVFTHPKNGDTYIKRIIGLPGDRVALKNGRLWINGVQVERVPEDAYAYREHRGGVAHVMRYTEILPGGRSHSIIERSDNALADTFAEQQVPEGHVFMMGDNRDNSSDSRFPEMGFVPIENLQGRADVIGWSLHSCEPEDGLTCADRRYLTRIR